MWENLLQSIIWHGLFHQSILNDRSMGGGKNTLLFIREVGEDEP
jgi:hypothetical protein